MHEGVVKNAWRWRVQSYRVTKRRGDGRWTEPELGPRMRRFAKPARGAERRCGPGQSAVASSLLALRSPADSRQRHAARRKRAQPVAPARRARALVAQPGAQRARATVLVRYVLGHPRHPGARGPRPGGPGLARQRDRGLVRCGGDAGRSLVHGRDPGSRQRPRPGAGTGGRAALVRDDRFGRPPAGRQAARPDPSDVSPVLRRGRLGPFAGACSSACRSFVC